MEGLKRENEFFIPLSESITISINSSDEFAITESESESGSVYLPLEEELPDQNRDKFSRHSEIIKNFQNIIGNQRESINLFSSQQSYIPNSIINLLNEENIKNNNTYSELDYGYKELDKLMSKYTFYDAAKIILKIHNGIPEDNNENNELYQKLKNISSVIKNKNNLTLMCLGILSSKIQFKKDEDKNNEVIKQKIRKEEYNKNKKESAKEDKDISNIFERIKKHGKKKYIYRNHYYKLNNRIYCYKNKSLEPRHYATLFCEKRYSSGCNAKILVNYNPNDILIFGHHKHGGISKIEFYKRFTTFKGKKWNHIQLIRKGINENIIYYN
jgi:hypothetical protein